MTHDQSLKAAMKLIRQRAAFGQKFEAYISDFSLVQFTNYKKVVHSVLLLRI
jgi:hypothetical protein